MSCRNMTVHVSSYSRDSSNKNLISKVPDAEIFEVQKFNCHFLVLTQVSLYNSYHVSIVLINFKQQGSGLAPVYE